jgi:hypothetical protein
LRHIFCPVLLFSSFSASSFCTFLHRAGLGPQSSSLCLTCSWDPRHEVPMPGPNGTILNWSIAIAYCVDNSVPRIWLSILKDISSIASYLIFFHKTCQFEDFNFLDFTIQDFNLSGLWFLGF